MADILLQSGCKLPEDITLNFDYYTEEGYGYPESNDIEKLLDFIDDLKL